MDHYNVDPALRALVERVASVRSVTADPPGVGYVGVRPAAWGTVSAYFHSSYVDVALSPHKAEQLHRDRGWKLVKTNGTTGVVRLKAAALTTTESLDDAVALLISAVDKSEEGTPYEGGKGGQSRPATKTDRCRSCGVQKLGGHCDACD